MDYHIKRQQDLISARIILLCLFLVGLTLLGPGTFHITIGISLSVDRGPQRGRWSRATVALWMTWSILSLAAYEYRVSFLTLEVSFKFFHQHLIGFRIQIQLIFFYIYTGMCMSDVVVCHTSLKSFLDTCFFVIFLQTWACALKTGTSLFLLSKHVCLFFLFLTGSAGHISVAGPQCWGLTLNRHPVGVSESQRDCLTWYRRARLQTQEEASLSCHLARLGFGNRGQCHLLLGKEHVKPHRCVLPSILWAPKQVA